MASGGNRPINRTTTKQFNSEIDLDVRIKKIPQFCHLEDLFHQLQRKRRLKFKSCISKRNTLLWEADFEDILLWGCMLWGIEKCCRQNQNVSQNRIVDKLRSSYRMCETDIIKACRIWTSIIFSGGKSKIDIRVESYLHIFKPSKISDRLQIFNDFRYANYLWFDRSDLNLLSKTELRSSNYMPENSNYRHFVPGPRARSP